MNDIAITPLNVNCTNCESVPGEKCTQPTNDSRVKVNWFHFARIDKAEVLQQLIVINEQKAGN